ncbi:ABC transporter six-transmembrane domain-containing protein [Leclercia adecarboxylata]|jgi:MFS family permease|uniref:ABC transporter six-transmembrane domain-containing protein n=1 Tax=Leclercia adecarboxylata TaxID=83655 RepID=UPI000E8E308D|nr:ABC transporter six-transmembrane domain-containing protein [Leclercia adecarboxylata]MCU6675860.1 ABC transporter six-transmembrane domain-containing protein [Leclercia adecarboxylata]MCV3305180.1 ABC transporter six-transmembrane domain-containing protein [Leclercia adecarboxylata]MCV3308448.1 ABC transporter six-transmembrane domain-containing protein [Leclercia adecarboxylata]MDH6161738.1 MFS family permease [Leclercia adecarboxylata]MDU1092409.1 ABC transporter six-transmembrane domain
MLTLKNAAPAAVSNSAVKTLKLLGQRHSRKLILTFLLVAAENITMLLYPLLAGFAINAIVTGQALHAVLYAVMVFVMWAIGAARRSIDTRTFARIYAELAVPVIIAQREEQHSASTIAARVALSREFVDFFEKHLPVLVTSVASIIGAAVMLLLLQFWTGVACLFILAFFALFLPGFSSRNEALFVRLNDRLEKEVAFVNSASRRSLSRHYDVLARLRIKLSDREAFGYLAIGTVTAILFASTILTMSFEGGLDAGHIYSVMTYMWMFAMSLDDGPQLLEKYSQLKDIGKRVNTSTL